MENEEKLAADVVAGSWHLIDSSGWSGVITNGPGINLGALTDNRQSWPEIINSQGHLTQYWPGVGVT